MSRPNSKNELLSQIRDERLTLVSLLIGLSEQELCDVPVVDEMTIKNLLAHVTYWEQDFVNRARAAEQRTVLPPLLTRENEVTESLDEINAKIFARSQQTSWGEVWIQFTNSYQKMLSIVEAMGERDIFSPTRGLATVGDAHHSAFDLLYTETIENYREHSERIRVWRLGRST